MNTKDAEALHNSNPDLTTAHKEGAKLEGSVDAASEEPVEH